MHIGTFMLRSHLLATGSVGIFYIAVIHFIHFLFILALHNKSSYDCLFYTYFGLFYT